MSRVVSHLVKMLPSTVAVAFEEFREHLDEHYDRRERLIKVCTCVEALGIIVTWPFLINPRNLGEPRHLGRLQEGHLSHPSGLERGVQR